MIVVYILFFLLYINDNTKAANSTKIADSR